MGGVEYTGAVDVWALGCIFAELLQRQVSSDLGALNKNLTVKPLFGFEDTKLASPPTGEHYDDEGCDESAEQRQAQLDTLFNVIGTPAWAEIERIKSPHWREYLRSLPGRAGNLDIQFQRVTHPDRVIGVIGMCDRSCDRQTVREACVIGLIALVVIGAVI